MNKPNFKIPLVLVYFFNYYSCLNICQLMLHERNILKSEIYLLLLNDKYMVLTRLVNSEKKNW